MLGHAPPGVDAVGSLAWDDRDPRSSGFQTRPGELVVRAKATPRAVHTTLLDLVTGLARQDLSKSAIVTAALESVESGRVMLTGNFRGCPLRRLPDAQRVTPED